jgi:NTP-dependent ternary conflict system VMAP-like protein/trypsin-like peptidase/effector-associated domain 2 (EAD2)-containing protein
LVSPTSAETLDGWQVRIADESGRVRGSGVLITPRHVLTCAHVLGAGPEPPVESFVLYFPRSERQHRLPGTVLRDTWSLDAGDFAVLEMDAGVAADVAPARVGPAAPGEGRVGRVFGRPPDMPEGVWERVTIGETVGPRGERVQLSSRLDTPRGAVEPGYSGGGVIDDSTGAVVGIIVSGMIEHGRPFVWMVPMGVVASHSTLVRTLLEGPALDSATYPEPGAALWADLRDALIRIPYFRDTHTRRRYLDAFSRRMRMERGVVVEVPPSFDPRADAVALLDVCRAVPDSLEALVKDFPAGEAGGPELRELALLIELVSPERLLGDHERRDLVVLLGPVPVGLLRLAYRRTVPWPSGGQAMPTEPAGLVRLLESMAQHPSGLPRILTFAEQVAAVTDNLISEGLWRWTDRVAARLLISRSVVEGVRRSLAESAAPPADPVLTVQLAPDALRPADRFLLTATLDDDGRRRVLISNDEPLGLEAVRAALDRALGDVHEALDSAAERLGVEIVVPRALLTEPFDRWETTETLPVALGARYPVVLRSYERMRQSRLWPQWREKWRLAREQTTTGSHVMHYVAGDDAVPAQEVYRGLASAEKLALVLGGPPARQPGLAPPDAFAAALQAGVAYVIWLREVSLAAEFHAAVEGLLNRVPVRELSAYVAQWRSAGGGRDQAGMVFTAHVSIMACDYDRRDPFPSRFLGPPRRRD